ncbi:MAG: glycosyltransferase family 39 protein [Anaerolineaceae bacterium]|nr:glycosyltransferase family 39 protein [Anaerolineaceae bacterium]
MRKSSNWFAVLIVVLALAARIIPGPRTIDDSFITFRYARNLLSGEGFVYNPGQRVMGTTTPLYTFLMAGMAALTGGPKADFPALALGLNAVADAVTCLLLWQLGKRFGSQRAGAVAAVLWAVAPFSVTFAIGGLETSVYVLLITATAYFYVEKRYVWTALAAALALLTRVDALILFAPLGLDWLVRILRKQEKWLVWQVWLAFLLPTVAWYGFATLYFGSPFPHSVSAKLVTYRLEEGASLIRLIQHYANPFFEYNTFRAVGTGLGLVLYPFLFGLGAIKAFRSEARSLPWIIYPWLYLLAFAIPNPLIFRWYLTPPLPAYFLFILIGLDRVLTGIFSARMKPGVEPAGWRVWAPLILLAAWPLGLTMTEWRLHTNHGVDRPAPDMAYIQLELYYRQVADEIAPTLNADSVLAAGDVGVLGFYTPARILDTVGLNSPESLNYYPLDESLYEINYAVAPALIRDMQPDAVVILEVYGRLGLLKEPWFAEQYRLRTKVETDMYGSDGMLVFERSQP